MIPRTRLVGWRGFCTVWLAGLAVMLALAGCGAPQNLLEQAIRDAAQRHPGYATKWNEVIRDLAHRYVADLHSSRLDPERGLIAKQALDRGCQDPFVRYLWFRHQATFTDPENEAFARTGWAIANEMYQADYPPFVRTYAENRIYKIWWRMFRENESAPARQLYQRNWQDFFATINDPAVPEWLVRAVCNETEYLWSAHQDNAQDLRARIDAVLQVRFGDCATAHYRNGERLLDVIRDQTAGRNSIRPTEKNPEAQSGIATVQAELERAWQLDCTDPDIAASMIDVCRFRKLPQTEMDQWFQRGLATGRDGTGCCRAKFTYLSPQWHGNLKEQLAFVRECTAHPEYGWAGPLLAEQAHREYRSTNDLAEDYLARPEVWADIRQGYEAYLRQYPDEMRERLAFARHAWIAHDWAVLGAQLKQLDPSVLDLARVGGKVGYQQMVTAAQTQGQPSSTPNASKSF